MKLSNHIKIESINKNALLSGDNCKVILNDLELKGVKSINFSIDARSCGVVTLQLISEIDVENVIVHEKDI